MTRELELADWRRRVAELYADVRATERPEKAHALWRNGRDALFRDHPQSPLKRDDPLRQSGLPIFPYDPGLRFVLELEAPRRAATLAVATGEDGTTSYRLAGHLALPEPVGSEVDVWWLEQYGGGLFLPLRDGTAGRSTYGGGRYLVDTVKGADLGGSDGSMVIDLNFLYHPSCRYDPAWQCPLAPPGNTIEPAIAAGERMP